MEIKLAKDISWTEACAQNKSSPNHLVTEAKQMIIGKRKGIDM